jgi:diguanylate cyclase (GGDEF)-like protein
MPLGPLLAVPPRRFGFTAVNALLALWGPVGLPLATILIWGAMLRGPWESPALLPMFHILVLSLYAGAGLWWALGAGVAGALTVAVGLVFAVGASQKALFLFHAAVGGALLAFLSRGEERRWARHQRRQEELDCLDMGLARLAAENETFQRDIADGKAQQGAYARLQDFADGLVGPAHRDDLLARVRRGLEDMFPGSRAGLTLFPGPDAPATEDLWGQRSLQWGQPRLFPSADPGGTATWAPGRFFLIPLKGRDAVTGYLSLESVSERPFPVTDLRLVAVAADLIALALDNTERFAHTESLAITDELTGLFTRGYFNERLQEEFRKARHRDRPLSLAIVDIDFFKAINDTHGHHLGDEVLRWLARLIAAQARETDFTARYGGEEFVILMPNTQAGDAAQFIRRLCRGIMGSVFVWENTRITLTVSAGVASLAGAADDMELLRWADEALYRAKKTGRNRVCCHE